MKKSESAPLLTTTDQSFLALFFAPFVYGLGGFVLSQKTDWSTDFLVICSLIQIILSAALALRGGKLSFADKPGVLLIPALIGAIPMVILLGIGPSSSIDLRRLMVTAIALTAPLSFSVGYLGRKWKRRGAAALVAAMIFPQSLGFCRWINERFDRSVPQSYQATALWTLAGTTAVVYPPRLPQPLLVQMKKTPRDGEIVEMELRPGRLGISWITNAKPTGSATEMDSNTFQKLRHEVWRHTGKRLEAMEFDMLALIYGGFFLPMFCVMAFRVPCPRCGAPRFRVAGKCRSCGATLEEDAFGDQVFDSTPSASSPKL